MMGFISEFALHARSADNGDWHEIITGFHAANQNIAGWKNIKRGSESFMIFLVLSLLWFDKGWVSPEQQ